MSSGYHAIVPTTNTTESATAVDVEAKGKDTGENNISGQPSGNTRSKSADSAHADHGQDLHANLHTVSMDCGDDASASTSPLLSPQQPPQHREAPALAPPPTQVFPHQQQGLASLTFSMQCDLLLQETAVRVVELLHHPLGVRGIIVVLEFVHNRMWTANSRFVALDAYKVCQAIHTAGQMPPMVLSKLSILDSEVSTVLCTHDMLLKNSTIYFHFPILYVSRAGRA